MVRKTKAEAEQTRQQIIDAARAVFAEKGVSRTTIDTIAKAAGVTRGAVYWHFENKEALFHAMREQVMLPLLDQFDDTLFGDPGADPLQTVEVFYLSMFAALENDSVMREIYEIMILKCEFVDEFAPVLQGMIGHCSEIVTKLTRVYARAAELGQLRPGVEPQGLARDTYLFVGGLMKTWLADQESIVIRPYTRQLIAQHLQLRRK
ncbi:MAG: TetR family transcriptional regulator [Pseudomonadota bacterium]|nr:TetR family transcriptional regulator [Pseudomonadota bacterium]